MHRLFRTTACGSVETMGGSGAKSQAPHGGACARHRHGTVPRKEPAAGDRSIQGISVLY
jgi:hypothetical protein